MQIRLEQLLRLVARDMGDLQAPYALVGGIAYGIRAEPRFTRDIVFTIAVSGDEEAEAVTSQLIHSGYYPEMEIANRHTGALATFRMRYKKQIGDIPVQESPYIDLLFSHCGIEKEVVETSTITEPVAGLKLPTATVPYLIAMKTLSESDRRLQDRIDLQNLVAVATEDDLALVPRLLDLITQRGFANGKDLSSVFQHFIDQPA